MPAHQVLSIVYIGYLCKENLFESRLRFAVEVASEFICILACVFMQSFLLPLTSAQKEFNENCFIAMIVLVIVVNAMFLCVMRSGQKRQKKHDQKLAKIEEFKKEQKILEKRTKKQEKLAKEAKKINAMGFDKTDPRYF